MKKLLFCVLVCTLFCQTLLHADRTFTVQEPVFKIMLNDSDVDNSKRNYPFLFYKNIVYFPLTSSDAAQMGLKTEWDEAAKTLSISSNGVALQNVGTPIQENANANWKRSDIKVVKPNFKIRINKKCIDNSKEEYPFFVYKDITYLPLTYRYVADEFHWFSAFSKEGFSLRNATPNNFEFLLEEGVFPFKNGQITYRKNDNVEFVYLNIRYKEKKVNLTEDLTNKLYPNHKEFGKVLLNTFWLEPPGESGKAKKVPNQVSIYVQGSLVLIPLAQEIDGVAENSIIRIDLDTMKIKDIMKISMDEALKYHPQNYLK